MANDASDLILFQLLSKANLNSEDMLLVKKYLTTLIHESVTSALSGITFPKYPDCPIPPSFPPSEVAALVRVVENVGDGNISHGIARFQENHNFIINLRKAQKTVAKSALVTFALMVVTGIGMAVWSYAKMKVSKGGG